MNILVWLGSRDMHSAIYPNMQSLAAGFADMGHNVITCNTAEPEEIKAAISLLWETQIIDLSVGVNAMGMHIRDRDDQRLDVYADLDIPHITILLDEPFNPYCNGYADPSGYHIITYLDRTDEEYFSRMNLSVDKYKMFMPLGGTASSLSLEELLEKKKQSPYDVVFSAGAFSDLPSPEWERCGACPSQYMVNLLEDIVYLLQNEPLSVVTAANKVLAARGMAEDCYFQAVAYYFPAILFYIKGWRRRKLLTELLQIGIEVDIFGGGWDEMALPRGAKVHGAISYECMLEVMTEAKVIVNDEAVFNDGAHDRVFTGMLNGAVVVSEYSAYLAEEFVPDRELFMFGWQDIGKQLQVIPQLLADDGYRENIACNAYGKAINKHTWRHRAEQLLEVAELTKFNRDMRAGKI